MNPYIDPFHLGLGISIIGPAFPTFLCFRNPLVYALSMKLIERLNIKRTFLKLVGEQTKGQLEDIENMSTDSN